MEYPVRFLGSESRRIYTQCTYHTFKLFMCFVLECCFEWCQQRGDLIVCLQDIKYGLVTFIKE